MEECERYRTNLQSKIDEYDSKRRENEQNLKKIQDLETMIKSLRETSDLQKQWNVENEVNKQELKRKQDDFEQFQRVCHQANRKLFFSLIHLVFYFCFARCMMKPKEKISKPFICLK